MQMNGAIIAAITTTTKISKVIESVSSFQFLLLRQSRFCYRLFYFFIEQKQPSNDPSPQKTQTDRVVC